MYKSIGYETVILIFFRDGGGVKDKIIQYLLRPESEYGNKNRDDNNYNGNRHIDFLSASNLHKN
jgi:hypothetical protein